MIQSQSFNAAVPFAEQLASKGRVAMAVPGTPLSELVRLSAPVFNAQLSSSGDLAAVGTMMQSMTEGTLEAPTQHSLELNAYVKDLSKLVSTHVAYAKNIIRPRVTELADAIIAYQSNNRPKLAGDSFTLQTLRMPAVLKDESFLDSLSYYKDKSVLTTDLHFALEPKSKEELTELVLTGSDRVDRQIVEWLSHQHGDFLLSTWNTFFTTTQVSLSTGVANFEDVGRLNAFERADQALAIYLLARKITDQVQSTTIPLNAYKNIALQYTDYAGAQLVDALKRIALMIKTKSLIVAVDSAKRSAKLNGEVYGEWLDAGNTPEIILGLIVSGNQPSSVDLINQNAEEHKRQWNSYVTFYNTSESNKSLQYLKDYIVQCFADSLKSREAIEDNYVLKNPSHLHDVVQHVQAEVNSMKTADFKDPYTLALCLVAKHRFYYTSAYQILSDIHQAGLVNPNVDVREAALLAVINYVADYLAMQMSAGI
jgi:hypothetical protein